MINSKYQTILDILIIFDFFSMPTEFSLSTRISSGMYRRNLYFVYNPRRQKVNIVLVTSAFPQKSHRKI